MPIPGKAITRAFYVRNLGREIITPDQTPTCTLIRNGIETTVVVTVSDATDNGFFASATIPSNWVEGDSVHLRISATRNDYPISQTLLVGEVGASVDSIADAVAVQPEIAQAIEKIADQQALRGFDPNNPMTANKTTGTIQSGNRRVIVTENGDERTYTRDDL